MSQQLPAFENEDFGLLLYGLASLAQPLQPTLLTRLCSEVKSKLYGLSGEGLGLLVWGMAQYDFEMREADEWYVDMLGMASLIINVVLDKTRCIMYLECDPNIPATHSASDCVSAIWEWSPGRAVCRLAIMHLTCINAHCRVFQTPASHTL